ncbi:hypothetical protein EKE94_12865 [Mesobaculum littorinae]|uniref:Uncharacterized protein n=1 Tax=Mesobaculum littorinae TaxID=2486419 RepID=A0A438AFQ3_9RHOB|nr:hypothetical protein [Mesobaculum littorinae]RVV97437.1 hypothetical protein EKE94_12865 [Mesobaculum littorinae]
MTALRKFDRTPDQPPRPWLQEDAPRHALFHLRMAALNCRAAARLDLFRACQMLSLDRDAAATATAEALVRTLGQALHRAPRFYRPGSADISFDESWLVSLIGALQRGDDMSATFLLHSRVSPEARRSVGFLAAKLAGGLHSV